MWNHESTRINTNDTVNLFVYIRVHSWLNKGVMKHDSERNKMHARGCLADRNDGGRWFGGVVERYSRRGKSGPCAGR